MQYGVRHLLPACTCPRCFHTELAVDRCPGCGLRFARAGARVLDVLGDAPREQQAAAVERFYAQVPFPGYAEGDDAGTLLDRSRRSPFLCALDGAIDAEARVLDCGSGTSQLAAFLALAAPRRKVFAIDGCRESLLLADAFAVRAGAANLQLVRGDLFDLPVADAAFPVVLCRGVVHHTPDPYAALRSVARCVAPGGVLVLGFYESFGRLFHRARRGLSRALGRPVACLDPVLRSRDVAPDKQRVWTEDQYRHPLEHVLPLPRVVRALDDLGFRFVRTVPPAGRGAALFEPTPRPRSLLPRRLGFLLRGLGDADAGLVVCIARRR